MRHFGEFAQVLAVLLKNDIYMSAEHIKIREDLAQELQVFSKTLAGVKGQFPDEEAHRAAKKARTTAVKEEADLLANV